ncbi:MAG: GNAT family N-acetyltransferase [Holophagales bacterium]|nr:GNAT family N-acetyltransferase [Holophagales bacterium]
MLGPESYAEIELRRAAACDGPALTALAHRAKRHWGYPEAWIEAWRKDLTLGPELFEAAEVWKVVQRGAVLGCAAIEPAAERLLGGPAEGLFSVEHMWIEPEVHGRGIGRRLFEHLVERARQRGGAELEILSDPHAEDFYRHLGCVRIGEHTSELLGEPRVLPLLAYRLIPAPEPADRSISARLARSDL